MRRCSWWSMRLWRRFSLVLSGTTDINIGAPMAGRGESELDDLIGMFVNTLVLRTEVDPSAAFTTLLASARETDLQAFAHSDLPFERLVEVLDPVRSRAHHPLFQVALAFQNLGQNSLALPGLTGGRVRNRRDRGQVRPAAHDQ